MKKIIILFSLIFVLTGCTANYEVILKDNKITENLTLVETNKEIFDVRNDFGWTIRELFDPSIYLTDEFSKKNYDVKSFSNDDQLGLKYKSSSPETLKDLSLLNQCYENPVLEVEDNIITLDTGYNFECYDFYENLDTVKITFKTNHKVISNNADEVKDNSYTWNLTKDGDKRILISYDNNLKKSNLVEYIVISIVVLAVCFIGYLIYKKNKNSNKF